MIEQLALQDAEAGRAFALIDPHRDMVELVWAGLPPTARDRVVYFNAPIPRSHTGTIRCDAYEQVR